MIVLWVVLAVVLVVTGLYLGLVIFGKQVVATIKFHETISSVVADILREAIVFTPKVQYFTRPDDHGWLVLYVVDSPDAVKFVESVRAQLHARVTPPNQS